MSLRTSDRRHWCGSPPVGWKQLGFTAKMFENPGDCARRKYPWGTTPACALVRNDRAFSNSPFDCLFLTAPAQNAPPQSGLTPCQLPRRGSFFPNLPPRGRGTAAAAVRRAANLISYSCRWQLYHNIWKGDRRHRRWWMRGAAGVSCRKYARSKAPLQGELARRSRD